VKFEGAGGKEKESQDASLETQQRKQKEVAYSERVAERKENSPLLWSTLKKSAGRELAGTNAEGKKKDLRVGYFTADNEPGNRGLGFA